MSTSQRKEDQVRTVLPRPSAGPATLDQALEERRTVRSYSGAALTLAELSQLLWAGCGVTGESGERAAPSAGAQYPLHAYVAAGAVAQLPTGLYAYAVGQHALERVSHADLRPALGDAAIGDQPWVRDAAAIIVVMADLQRMSEHFRAQPPQGERGARYAYIETGALAQNVHLQAASLGLGVVLVAGFDDGKTKVALQAAGQLEPAALLCVGKESK